MMSRFDKKQIAIFAVLLLLVLALIGLLVAGLSRAADERRELEAEKDKHAVTAPLSGKEDANGDGSTYGYLRLAEGRGTLFLFGDEAIYGRGVTTPLSYDCEDAMTTQALINLREIYGTTLRAYAIREVLKAHTLTYAAEVVARLTESGTPPSLILLAPSDATLAAGLATDPAKYDFGRDLEGCIRTMRSATPYCDILLIIPANASGSTARTINQVAAHYGLLTVDLRAALTTGDGLLHTEGANAGYPTAAGHAAASELITAAVTAAVEGAHTSPALRADLLFPKD